MFLLFVLAVSAAIALSCGAAALLLLIGAKIAGIEDQSFKKAYEVTGLGGSIAVIITTDVIYRVFPNAGPGLGLAFGFPLLVLVLAAFSAWFFPETFSKSILAAIPPAVFLMALVFILRHHSLVVAWLDKLEIALGDHSAAVFSAFVLVIFAAVLILPIRAWLVSSFSETPDKTKDS